MNDITLKEYAKLHNISYEAVRKSVNRYKDELKGHIIKINKTQYLDDFAINFLDQKRKTNPIIIYELDKDEKIRNLEEENKKLHMLLEKKLMEIDELKNEKIEYLENKYLIENTKFELEVQKQKVVQLEEKNKILNEQLNYKNKNLFHKIFGGK